MKLRHATALALVGWYLMLPPSKLSPTIAYKAPLNTWQLIRSFDTADDCEDFRGTFFENSKEQRALGLLNPAFRDYMFAECVASDDTRLKEKLGTQLSTLGHLQAD